MVDQPVGPGNVAMQAPTGHLEIEVGQYLVQQQPATRTSPAGAAAAGRACLTAVLPAGAITLLGAYLCEVLGGHPNLSALSGLLVTASFVYALDRFVLHPEDPADVRQKPAVVRMDARYRRFSAGRAGGRGPETRMGDCLGRPVWKRIRPPISRVALPAQGGSLPEDRLYAVRDRKHHPAPASHTRTPPPSGPSWWARWCSAAWIRFSAI